MIAEIQYMEKSKVYRIRNRKTNYYLTSGDEVTMAQLNKKKISQLWLFDEVKPTTYEIVSLQSGSVLTRGQKIVIQKGQWLAGQFWKLHRAEITKNQNYFWIAANDDERKYLCASGANDLIKMRIFDPTLFVTNWNIQQVNIDEDLSGCCIFRSDYSDQVIDVPEGSDKEGISIIQYQCNGRGNQRWVLQNVINCFVIRNLCSNMILSPQSKPLKSSTKIIQSQFSNQPSQKWKIIETASEEHDSKNKKFLIQNVEDPTLFIGVSSKKQSANLILSPDKQKSLWKLQGSVPQVGIQKM